MQGIFGLDDSNGCDASSLFWAPEITVAAELDARYPIANRSINGSLKFFCEDERGGGWEENRRGYIDSFAVANLLVIHKSDDNWCIQGFAKNVVDEFTGDSSNNSAELS